MVDLQNDEFIIKVNHNSENKVSVGKDQFDAISFGMSSPERNLTENDALKFRIDRELVQLVIESGSLNMPDAYTRVMKRNIFGHAIFGELPAQIIKDDIIYDCYAGLDRSGHYVCEYESEDKKILHTFSASNELSIAEAVTLIKSDYSKAISTPTTDNTSKP